MLNVYYIGPYLYIEREIIVDSQDHSMIKTVKKTHTHKVDKHMNKTVRNSFCNILLKLHCDIFCYKL